MKYSFIAFALLLFCAPVAALAEPAPQYSSIASDLPLMPGLTEKAESLVLFDKSEGRIAEITMAAAPSQIEILEYYAKALPELGWRAENPQIWRRKGEQLTIRFNTPERLVTFHLEPFPQPPKKSAPNW